MTTWAQALGQEPADEPDEPELLGRVGPDPLVASSDVDQKVLEIMQIWMATYLRLLKDERGIELQRPREYATMLTDAELLDHPLPAVVASTAALTAQTGGMEKIYAGQWTTEVSVSVRGRDPRETRVTTSLFEAVTRRLMVQKARVTPLDHIHYTGMRMDQVPGDERAGRYVLRSTAIFQIWSEAIVDPLAGPDIPDADSYGPWPTSQTVEVDVDKVPLDEEP